MTAVSRRWRFSFGWLPSCKHSLAEVKGPWLTCFQFFKIPICQKVAYYYHAPCSRQTLYSLSSKAPSNPHSRSISQWLRWEVKKALMGLPNFHLLQIEQRADKTFLPKQAPQNPPSPPPPPPDCSSPPEHTVPPPTPEQAAHLPPSSLLCTLPTPPPPSKGSPANLYVLLPAGRKGGIPQSPLWHQYVPCALGNWVISLSYMALPGAHHNILLLSKEIFFTLCDYLQAFQLPASESLIPPCSVLLSRGLLSSSVATSIELPARKNPKNTAHLNLQAPKLTTFAGGTANDQNQLYCGWPWISSGERTQENSIHHSWKLPGTVW